MRGQPYPQQSPELCCVPRHGYRIQVMMDRGPQVDDHLIGEACPVCEPERLASLLNPVH